MRAILTYHSIDLSGSPISLSPAAFHRQIRHAVSAGIRIVSMGDLLSGDETDADTVALTFDDGYVNVAQEAMPLLVELGLPATIFVPTAFVGKSSEWARQDRHRTPELPLLDWDSLGAMSAQGMTIASHTRTHRRLTQLSRDQLVDEIAGAARDIAQRLGLTADGLAYPYGAVSEPVVRAAAGVHRWACTTSFGELRTDPAFALPRLDMWYFEQPGRFERWGTPWFRRWVRRRHRLRRTRAAVERFVPR
ncbi:MAG: polysaccharide deacetylase family protein [Acidobacteriota bacterium]